MKLPPPKLFSSLFQHRATLCSFLLLGLLPNNVLAQESAIEDYPINAEWQLVNTNSGIKRYADEYKSDVPHHPRIIGNKAYWLAGNVFINREDKGKAWALVDQVVEHIQQGQRSFIFMPEGTRSQGRGLLPFKKGAFAAAIKAGVPIVPICCSSVQLINIHHWHVKPAYVTYLDPIPTEGLKIEDAEALAQQCHDLMKNKIAELDQMVINQQ